MKRIFYIFIFIFVMILSCVSYVETPIVNRDGTYTGNQPTLQKRALQIIISGGGFNMGYVNTNGGTLTTGKSYTVYATNITGVDPNYSFQNSKGAGTLKFLTDNKVIVTFRELIPDYYTIGETVCTKQP